MPVKHSTPLHADGVDERAGPVVSYPHLPPPARTLWSLRARAYLVCGMGRWRPSGRQERLEHSKPSHETMKESGEGLAKHIRPLWRREEGK